MRSLPRSAKLALLASTTLVGGFAALFAVDGGGVALPGKSMHGARSEAAVLSAGRTRVIEASVFHMPSLDLGSTARGFAGLATPVSLDPGAMEDRGEDRPDLRGAGEDDPQGWPGVERGGKGDRWEIRPSTDLTLAPEASGTRAESDWLLPADGAPPLARLSRRLEPPAAGVEIQSFTRKRPSTILATTLTRAPDSSAVQTAASTDGGTTPTTSRPDLASLDTRPAGGPTASPTVVAAPGDEEALPKVALASVRPNLDPDGSTDVGPVEPDEGLTSAQKRGKLAGLPGLDDGVARPLTLPPVAFTKAQNCLATAIYFEARSESEKGRIAVAQVIINRVRSPYYPKNVCDVVYQGASDRRYGGCQFSFACDRIRDRVRNREAFDDALSVAQRVLDAELWLPEVGNATHYHATYVRPRWVRDMVEKDRIGRHIFYRVKWWA
jgi:hypothetical protein